MEEKAISAEEKIVMVVFDGKTFIAKSIEKPDAYRGDTINIEIINIIEILPVVNGKGQLEYMSTLLGDALQLPENCMIIGLDKKSKFYTSYFNIVSGLVTPSLGN